MSKRKKKSTGESTEEAVVAAETEVADVIDEGRPAEEALSDSDAIEAISAVENSQKKILVIAILVIAVLCGFLIWKQINASNLEKEGSAFSTAARANTVEAYDQIIADYAGSLAGGNALLMKAELLKTQNKLDDAKAALEKFAANYSAHPRYEQGLFALATQLHAAGDIEGAKANYEKITESDIAPLAHIRLGDIALSAGDTDLADQKYEESVRLYSGTRFADLAMQKLELAKIGDPQKVPRPKPEPPKIEDEKKPDAPAPDGSAPEPDSAEPKKAEDKPEPAPKKPEATPQPE